MAEFTLPKNSKVQKGKKYPAKAGAKDVRTFRVYRWNPDDQNNPHIDEYEVDLASCGPMVLDALIKIKNEIDATLTFRRSCREGICGSCAMNIDGTNTLACTKAIEDCKGDVKVYPLPHMPVVKDLVPDLTHFYAQYASIKPWIRTQSAPPPDAERLQSKEDRAKLDGLYECILLRVLLDASMSELLVETTTAIWSPAILLRSLSLDRRSFARRGHRRAPRRPRGPVQAFYRCHTIMNCTKTCPKGLNPAKAIGEIKKLMVERKSV